MANFVTNDYKLDITPQGSYPVVYMSQFEDGRQIRFRIMNKGMSYTIPVGVSAFISGLKSNGGYYEHTCEIDTTRKYITAPVEADMTDVNGRGVANITLTNGDGEKVVSAKFITHTQETVSDDGIEVPTEAETVFQQLLDEIRTEAAAIDTDIETLQNMVTALSEDTSDAIDIIDAKVDTVDTRMDNLVTDVHGAETVTLWSGSMSTDGGTYALSQSVANFDFIDIYYDNQYTGVANYLRIPANKTSAAVYIPYFETDSTNKPLQIGKVALTFSGTSVTVAAAKQWWWDGTNASNASVLNAQNSFPVRIDGVKSSVNINAELADVRVGANGVTYGSAGAAVRAQAATIVGTGLYIGTVPSNS